MNPKGSDINRPNEIQKIRGFSVGKISANIGPINI